MADNLTTFKCCLEIWEPQLLEPLGPVQRLLYRTMVCLAFSLCSLMQVEL